MQTVARTTSDVPDCCADAISGFTAVENPCNSFNQSLHSTMNKKKTRRGPRRNTKPKTTGVVINEQTFPPLVTDQQQAENDGTEDINGAEQLKMTAFSHVNRYECYAASVGALESFVRWLPRMAPKLEKQQQPKQKVTSAPIHIKQRQQQQTSGTFNATDSGRETAINQVLHQSTTTTTSAQHLPERFAVLIRLASAFIEARRQRRKAGKVMRKRRTQQQQKQQQQQQHHHHHLHNHHGRQVEPLSRSFAGTTMTMQHTVPIAASA
eukprot:Clim_evm42s22 gene=Clim_evmTU42s22